MMKNWRWWLPLAILVLAIVIAVIRTSDVAH
jgi:hypothetical protein